jgi:hypothetical protein
MTPGATACHHHHRDLDAGARADRRALVPILVVQ